MDTSKKRIAVCFSGQLRTWEKCIDTWQLWFKHLRETHNVEIDIFTHFWDHNTLPYSVLNSYNYKNHKNSNSLDDSIILSENEIHNYIQQLNPISYKISDIITSKKIFQQNKKLSKINFPCANYPIKPKLSPQLYSIMYTGHLKKMYEVNHNFVYDVCLRMRNDVYLENSKESYNFLNIILYPEFNTIYSCHTGIDKRPWFKRRLGDIMWSADSPTFDIVSNFYQWISTFDPNMFNDNLYPEHLFYYYVKMFNISTDIISTNIKLARDSRFVNPSESGVQLGDHEILC